MKDRSKTARAKPITASWLEASGLYYLGRFPASERRFREVMSRKISKRAQQGFQLTDEQKGLLDALVAKCLRYDYLNDERYAVSRADTLLSRGKPPRMIVQDLSARGIAAHIIESVLSRAGGGAQSESKALMNYAKRRRFGPFAAMSAKPKPADKQIAAMARAGFSYDLAKLVVEAESVDDLLQRLNHGD